MENFSVITTIHTAPSVARAASPPYATHSLTHVTLNTIFSMIVTSSKYGRGLSWFSLNDFVSLSSTHKTLHINSQQIWKNLLIDQNHGCLREEALFNPALFKTVYLQLNRFGISFETPQLVYMVASKGFAEMMSIFNANGNPILPEAYSKYSSRGEVLSMPRDPNNAHFVAALREYIHQIQEACAENGLTPLMFAAKTKDVNLVRALLAYKRYTDPDHYTQYLEARGQNNKTALLYASNIDDGHPEAVVCVLLENGANIEARGPDGNTPLIQAAKNRMIGIVRVLLEARADITAQDNYGDTALIHARRVRDAFHRNNNEIHDDRASYGSILEIQSEIVNLLIERQRQITHETLGSTEFTG